MLLTVAEDVAVQPARRARAVLLAQMRDVERYLALSLRPEDAAAMVGRGWRSRDWRGPATYQRYAGELEPDAGPSPREVPRWEAEVDRIVSRWPPLQQRLIQAAFLALHPRVRVLLDLHCRRGLSFRHITAARLVAFRKSTLWDAHGRALELIARRVWDDGGLLRV